MDSQKRLFLAISLSMLLFLVWSSFFAPKPPAMPTENSPGANPQQTAANGMPQAEPSTPVQSHLPSREIAVETPEVSLLFTTEGAGLLKAQLKGDKEREQETFSLADGYKKLFGKSFAPPPHIQLVNTAPQGSPFWATSFVGTLPLPDNLRYALVEETPQRLSFRAEHEGLVLVKVFEFQDGNNLNITLQLSNNTLNPQSGTLWLKSPREVPPGSEKEPSFFGTLGNQSSVLCRSEKLHRETPNNKSTELSKEGPVHFVAVDKQYFIAALYAPTPTLNPQSQCRLKTSPTSREADLGFNLNLQPGSTTSIQLKGYLGAKDLQVLSSKGAFLEETLDFGWWAAICKLLLGIMRFFYGLLGNWGLAIIFLTVVVKLVLLPLTHKAMVSAEQMKKLQPQITALREKYAKDKERLNMEMMKLYQTAKINPLGGCLPLLLQMPVWFALFTTLRTSYEIYREPFFGPAWTDLTSKDPTYLLPILLGVTMIITQKLQPQMMEKTQAFMFTWVMPIFFSFIMLNYPAGLSLYIFVNNILSIGQQFALRKWIEKRSAKTTDTPKTAKAK
ncbi:MAG: membrane protein insertase YidC [Cystobacterineae bacterium]|nr:membrane protein insertase YidC [Cystobacterineae bacterium]